MNNEEQRVEHEVLNAIKNRKAKMRPRWYFIAKAVLMIVAVVFLLFLIFFMVSFMLFALEANGGLFAIHFGLPGLEAFLGSLPWTLLLLSLALLLVLVLLLKRYAFVYHHPILYLLLILIVLVSLASFFISMTSFHIGIYRYASGNRFQIVRGVYQFETTPMSNIYRGQAVFIGDNGFILANGMGETSTVILDPNAISQLQTISLGEFVIIFGHRIATNTIEASGIAPAITYE